VRAADGDLVDIDGAADSAFRFFPIERDPVLGWRLHLFDAATNKALTLAARTETRDYVDIVELDARFPLPPSAGPPAARIRGSRRCRWCG
jgi:hypothetical protein